MSDWNRNAEWKRKQKAKGMCTWCGKKPIFKHGACLEHSMKADAINMRFQLKNPKYSNMQFLTHRQERYMYNNAHRKWLKEQGRCIDCLKQNDNLPHVRCVECAEKNAESIRRWRERKRTET